MHKEVHSPDNSKPLISIITPTFNRGYIIGNTIESVISQTYSNWEHIIIDDGSTDDTGRFINTFKEPRIKYLYQSNRGQSSARNKGLDVAQGAWVAYLDSDNELFPNYLEVMLDSVTRSDKTVFAVARGRRTLELYENGVMTKYIDESSDFPESLTAKDIGLKTYHFDTNGFMHSRAVIDAGIRFDERMRSFEDWDFAIQIAERFPQGLLYVKEELVHYHQRYGTDGLVSNASYADWAELFEYIYQKHKSDKILEGQTWYPDRVVKYRHLQEEYLAGNVPPPYLRPFIK